MISSVRRYHKKIFLVVVIALAAALLGPHQSIQAVPHRDADALDVVISEVAWMGTRESYNDEWIELYNNTGSFVDLNGWTLAAADGTPGIILNGTIPAGGHFLLERTDDTTVPGVAADQLYTGALENGGEDLQLRDGSGAIVDQVDNTGGWFAGHAEGRVSMLRVDVHASGNDVGNWTYNPRCGSATNSAGQSHTCTLSVLDVGSSFDYSLYFNERFDASTVTDSETSLESALLSQIDGANTSIDVSLYGLGRQRVIDALIAADDRGVTVRVVGDDQAQDVDYTGGYQALADAGIPIVSDNSTSKIQHNKFLVIDGGTVWTGSTNFTDTGLTLNANNNIVIQDSALANTYSKEFEEMWSGDFHGNKDDNTRHLFNYQGTLVESYFSATDLVAFEVWEELAGADETIHFAMFFWTDDLLAERVIDRIHDGVNVHGVWDELGAANTYSEDEALASAGAEIYIENRAGKTHHKFAVIDVEGSDPTVVLGSYNWTASGAYDNDENTLIIHDRELARAYYAEWHRLRYSANPVFADVIVDYWAHDWIEALADAGITGGYPDGTYRPAANVSRAEMAVFLLKGMNTGTYSPPAPDGSHPFSDIAGHWAELWMEELYDEGLTSGYPDGTYRPQNEVTRAEMAVFLLRAKHGAGYSPPAASGGAFSDIADHWAEPWIEQLAEEGITGGYPDGTYRPNNPVNRAEMAVFLVTTFDLPMK